MGHVVTLWGMGCLIVFNIVSSVYFVFTVHVSSDCHSKCRAPQTWKFEYVGRHLYNSKLPGWNILKVSTNPLYDLFIQPETTGYLESLDPRPPSLGARQTHLWKFPARRTCLLHAPRTKPKSWRSGAQPRLALPKGQRGSAAELVIQHHDITFIFIP